MRVSKTLNLRKALQKELKTITENVFYEEAINGASYPYVVYELEGIQENYQLEVNVYDKGTSTSRVETLADDIATHFGRYIYRDEEQSFTTYINTRNIVREEDNTLKRRRLLIDIKYFGKG